MTEGEMVGWHHRLNGQESEQAPGHSEGQPVCCGPWGRRAGHDLVTEQHKQIQLKKPEISVLTKLIKLTSLWCHSSLKKKKAEITHLKNERVDVTADSGIGYMKIQILQTLPKT